MILLRLKGDKNMYQIVQKEKNKSNFLNYLYFNKSISIPTSAKDLGITYPTAKKIVDDLIKDNLIIKLDEKFSSGGRGQSVFLLNENLLFSIGIQIEKGKISFILINILGKILKEKTIVNAFFNQENFLKYLIDEFSIFYEEIDMVDKINILGVGVSFPGIVNNEEHKIVNGINLKLKEINLKTLEEKFDLNFYLENEANVSIYSEKILGIGQELGDFIVISIASGIGAGIFLNSKIFRGNSGIAGEVGHICIEPNGEQCNCGNIGCWELYASESALLKNAEKILGQNFSLEELFSLENEEISILIEKYIKYLGIGIRNILFSLNINSIILSGSISVYLEKYDFLLKTILTKNEFFSQNDIKIHYSNLNKRSNSLGAAFIPISKYFSLVE